MEDPEYQANLRQRATRGELAPGLEAMFYHYAYGRPPEQQADEQAFVEALLMVVLKHASTDSAKKEIREVLEAHTGGATLRAVA